MRRAAASVLCDLVSGSQRSHCASLASTVARVQAFRGPSSFRTHSPANPVLGSPPTPAWELGPVQRAAFAVLGRRSAASHSCSSRPLLAVTRPVTAAVARGMGTVASTSASSAQPAAKPSCGKGREFPDNVRVGVGVVILRAGPPSSADEPEIEVLMARRAKAPDLGMWSFPGGGQRLGETLVECACRETLEETGLTLGGVLEPRVLTAVDCIKTEEASGRVQFHYTIIEVVSSLAADTMREQAASDVSELTWLTPGQIAELEGKGEVSRGCADVAFEARQQCGDVVNSRDESTTAMRSY